MTINYTGLPASPRFGENVSPKFSLTEGSIPRALLSFSLPILSGNVLQSINGSVNAVWVGKFLGAASLAAVGNANVVMFLLFGVMFGFSMASTIMVAQCVGAKNIAEAKRVVGTSAVFFLGLSLAMSLTGFALAQLLVVWLHTPPDALPLALTYMRIIFLALPFMGGLFFLMAVLRGAGDSRTPFVYLFMSVVLDIALNPLLIFGFGPVPRLGIAGSAAATLIAQCSSFFALVAHLYRTKHFLCIRGDELSLFKVDWRLVRILVAKGIPMGLQMFVVSSSMVALTSLVNRFGSEETAAFNAAMQLWNYVQMPALAIGAAASSMAAQNVGAGKWDRVGKVATTGVIFNLLIGGALIAIVYALNKHALGLFLPADSAALNISAHLNAIVIWSFAMFGTAIVLYGVVRATGAVIPPLIMLAISLWLLRVPFAYWMVDRWQADAIWWSFPLSSMTSMLLSIAYYRFGGWRKIRLGVVRAPAAPVPGV
ncbi:MAG TPA: MATE family efflux transporter [Steroidobacteraceae bacterium]|jgi:putative MATE family efflux protein|nr:MATE family efflux transporter [Steroidobacteraceae bacterium]